MGSLVRKWEAETVRKKEAPFGFIFAEPEVPNEETTVQDTILDFKETQGLLL